MYVTKELFDLSKTIAAPLLENTKYPWEALGSVGEFILETGKTLSPDEYDNPQDGVWIAKDAKVYPTAYINGPCIICAGAEVRHCAFIRGNAIVGKKAVVGNSTELKNVILFDEVQVPHYNYVGDSILGFHAHMGAGSITSNVKSDNSNVVVRDGDERVETNRRKIGAIIGDRAEVGCNSVLNPGAVIGRHATVYPLSSVRGTVKAGCIYKNAGEVVEKR